MVPIDCLCIQSGRVQFVRILEFLVVPHLCHLITVTHNDSPRETVNANYSTLEYFEFEEKI